MKSFLFLLLGFLLVLARPCHAQLNGDGLKGIYYDNANLTNAAVTAVDPMVSFRWGGCPPQPNMPSTVFSVQWSGQIEAAYSEPYTFIVDVNGGVSLVVNGQVLVNQWTDLPPPVRGFAGVVTLTAGVKAPIEVDYFTSGANPSSDLIQLAWQSPSQGLEYIPRQYLFSGAALNPTPTPQALSACQAAAVVDGVLDEWAWAGPSGWNSANRTVVGNAYGSTASFKTLWDSANLYLGVTVTDSQLTNTGVASTWKNSTVELYLDTTDSGGVTFSGNDYEYFFRWNDTVAAEAQGRTAGVSLRTTTLPSGYLVEASIPWSTLGMASPSAGMVLGFDLGLDVNHNGGNCRDGQIIWNGGSDDYENPSAYAKLSLAGACPTPVSTPPLPTGGDPYAAPNPTNGGNVRIVYDMGGAGTAKIKVWNAWGNLVATLSEPKAAGLQSSLLNVSSFAPGHYFYRVELDYGSGRADRFKTQVLAVQK
ncbi:MAG TPA: sugar-binding protein [bacterium]|nr:sugar-binding protein [bacterium]